MCPAHLVLPNFIVQTCYFILICVKYINIIDLSAVENRLGVSGL